MTVPGPATSGSRRWVFWIFLALALFYLGVEHRAHLAGTLRWLPLAILLLCPLMHVFMHNGLGGHGGDGCHGRDGNADDPPHGHHLSRRNRAWNDETSDTSNEGHRHART